MFIDTGVTRVTKQPGIYAIQDDSGVVLRGIRGELGGGFTLFAHNKKDYSDQPMTESQLQNLGIIGKYIGHWQWADKKL